MKKYHKRNSTCFAGALISILASNSLAVVLQFFKGDVLDHAVAGEIRQTVLYAGLLFCFILGEVLFFFLYRLLGAKYVVGCTECLKHDIFESILGRSYVAYLQNRQGEYISRYVNDADSIKARHFEMQPLFWEILFKILLVSAGLFLLDGRIAVVTLALLTTPLYVPKLIEGRLQKAQTEYLKALEDSLAKLNDWLSGFEIIKNFSIERKILARFDEANDSAMEKLLRDKELGAAAQLITTLISYLSYFTVLICAAWLVLKGEFSAGDFFVAVGMIDQLSYPLISLAEIIRQLIAIKPACTAMEEFIGTQPKTVQGEGLRGFQNEIRFEHISFAYDEDRPILRDLNFCIKKGERCLLQGPSGCGKTTAVNLLLRYFDADSGRITIDGIPIEKIGSPYGVMTVVRQEAVLFCDTLRNNLTMYRAVPDEKLMALLRRLGLDKFANTRALDAVITENGANLSGGEKKRICFARALLRDTEILILDEPLANLDEGTAGKIEDLLLSIADRTLIVVSHQFSADKVGEFDQIFNFSDLNHQ